jgi:hypothetical protein
MKARDLDESEGYLIGNNNILLLVENVETVTEIVESHSFSKRIDQTILKELKILIKSFFVVKDIGNIETERNESHFTKQSDSNFAFSSYPTSLSLNHINNFQISKMAISLQTNIGFSVIKSSVEGTSSKGTDGKASIQSSSNVDKSKFQLVNHVHFFKFWEDETLNPGNREAGEIEGENTKMIQERSDEEVIEFLAEPKTGPNQKQPRKQSRPKTQAKPTDLIKNLDSLNISDNLKAKFLTCLKPSNNNNEKSNQ